MKNISLLLFLLLFTFIASASHQRGGYITYTLASPDDIYTYTIRLVTYTDTRSIQADRPYIKISFGDGDSENVNRRSQEYILPQNTFTFKNMYEVKHTYEKAGSYLISSWEPNMIDGIVNVNNSIAKPMIIQSLLRINPSSGCNSSPQIYADPVLSDIAGISTWQAIGVYDIEGDSLSYEWVANIDNNNNPDLSYQLPVGVQIKDNRIRWKPSTQGLYLFNLKIHEWREGREMGNVTYSWISSVQANSNADTFQLKSNCSPNDTMVCHFDGRTKGIVFEVHVDRNNASSTQLKLFSPPVSGKSQPLFIIIPDTTSSAKAYFYWNADMQPVAEQTYHFIFRANLDYGNVIQVRDRVIDIIIPGHSAGCQSYLSIQENEPKERPDANLFPNPLSMGNDIHISPVGENTVCDIFSADGKLIYSGYPVYGIIPMPKSAMQPGIYIYRLRNNTEILGKGKLVIRP